MVSNKCIKCKKEADEKDCPPKKRRYSQKYCSSWEHLELYSGWLRKSTFGIHHAYCALCSTNLSLKAGITDLRKHARSKKHINKCSAVVENLKQDISSNNNVSSSYQGFVSKLEDPLQFNSTHENDIENSANKVNHDSSYHDGEGLPVAEIPSVFVTPNSLKPDKNSNPPVSDDDVIVSSSVSEDISFNEDEFDSFGKFVTAQLRKFPEKMAVEMTLEIHNLITQRRLTLIKEQNLPPTRIANSQLITVSIPNIPKVYSSDFTMSTLTYSDPLLANYAFYVALITCKLISMSALTSVVRLINMTFANEEDAALFSKRVNMKDPIVERIRRAHLNDLENIPAFWIIGFLYVLSYPSVFIATLCFRVFAVSRFIHTVSYLLGIGKSRGISYVVGLVVLIFMTLNIIVSLL